MLSVRFYKSVILCSLALVVLTPTVSSIYLLIQNQKLRLNQPQEHTESEDLITVAASEFTPGQPALLLKAAAPGYQDSYPDFRTDSTGFDTTLEDKKVVYLTFDDGPSVETSEILDILALHDVKATFFVNNKMNGNLTASLKKIAEAGHTVGMHGASHRYAAIYGSVENFLADFNRNFQYIKSVTGTSPAILRFPGGSINAYNFQNYQQIIAEILRRGFVYYDWNVSGADATPDATPESVAATVTTSVLARHNSSVVLLHDSGKMITVKALPAMIESLKSQGYIFRMLDNRIVPTNFAYLN